MVRNRDAALAKHLSNELKKHDGKVRALPGLTAKGHLDSLVAQLIDSIRRIRFISALNARPISPSRTNPSSDLFDPIRAAIVYLRNGEIEEAFWLVFLFVHFGKHRVTGWRLARDVYGGLGGNPWTWARVSQNPKAFEKWLGANQVTLQGRDGVERKFGNHRKYETLDVASSNGTAAVVKSYVAWIGGSGSHQKLFGDAVASSAGPRDAFKHLFGSMAVHRFGRTAKLDYLAMVGKIGLAKIDPDVAYIQGSTGPLKGARLLFGGKIAAPLSPADLEQWVVQLAKSLGIGPFELQVLEDALCNWQKSPAAYEAFRG